MLPQGTLFVCPPFCIICIQYSVMEQSKKYTTDRHCPLPCLQFLPLRSKFLLICVAALDRYRIWVYRLPICSSRAQLVVWLGQRSVATV